jgi:hypothetical protein
MSYYTSCLVNEVTELSAKYCRLIESEYHKEEDCHWFINVVWSYGERPKYSIEHDGYLFELTRNLENTTFNSYEDALRMLISLLKEAIKDIEIQYSADNYNEGDSQV